MQGKPTSSTTMAAQVLAGKQTKEDAVSQLAARLIPVSIKRVITKRNGW